MEHETESPLMGLQEVAEMIGCSGRNVHYLRKSGRMPKPIKIGRLARWKRTDMVAWIDGGCGKCADVHAPWRNILTETLLPVAGVSSWMIRDLIVESGFKTIGQLSDELGAAVFRLRNWGPVRIGRLHSAIQKAKKLAGA